MPNSCFPEIPHYKPGETVISPSGQTGVLIYKSGPTHWIVKLHGSGERICLSESDLAGCF